jgi:hypothetical protein
MTDKVEQVLNRMGYYTMPPWSFSALTKFETCPKQYFHTKVAKDILDLPGEAAKWGQEVHKHLEDRVRDGTPLPASIHQYESLVQPILAQNGEKIIEQQYAVSKDLAPTNWESPDAWCRGIIDIGVVATDQSKAVLLDWKTGKRKPDSDQLMLFAGLAFSHYPELNVVSTGFVWLKDKKMDKEEFTRADVPRIWQTFIPRVQRLERAYDEGKFQAKPSGLCKNYCPVPKSLCSFSGRN